MLNRLMQHIRPQPAAKELEGIVAPLPQIKDALKAWADANALKASDIEAAANQLILQARDLRLLSGVAEEYADDIGGILRETAP